MLRDFAVDDWPAVHAYASRPEVYRFQPWGPTTLDDARGYVELAIRQAQQQPRTEYSLALVLAATNTVIGAGSLVIHSQQHRHGEIGYFLHPGYWGQGYATEVARLLLHFGFATLSLHRIFASCDRALARFWSTYHAIDSSLSGAMLVCTGRIVMSNNSPEVLQDALRLP